MKASHISASPSRQIYVGSLVQFTLRLSPIGRLIASGLSNCHLDYNLIEVKSPFPRLFNQITSHLDYKTTIIYPHRVAGTLLDTNVFAVTGSTGVMTGRLCGTPNFARVDNCFTRTLDCRTEWSTAARRLVARLLLMLKMETF